ncbi:UNVERIFIED_CONTAM: hypothetical protein RMT77_001522 [Armadillidium vulgare]
MKSWIVFCLLIGLVSNVRTQLAPNIHGRCPSQCPFRYECAVNTGCQFGYETGYCNCCTRCKKGPGEICGGPLGQLGSCGEGYFCDITQTRVIYRVGNPLGICRPKLPSPCFLQCNIRRCPVPHFCTLGIERDLCGCCTQCLRTSGEPCGRDASCGNGLYCDHTYGIQGFCNIWSLFSFPDPIEFGETFTK